MNDVNRFGPTSPVASTSHSASDTFQEIERRHRAAADMDQEQPFSPAFWRAFTQEHWERTPCVLAQPFGARGLASTEEAYQGLVRAGDIDRAGGEPYIRFYAGEHHRVRDLSQHFASAGDRSLDGYLARLSERSAPGAFSVVLNNFQLYDFDVWDRVRSFLSPLFREVGLPTDHADCDLFISNNRFTPFGIHTDRASNFSWVLKGHKTMRVWPASRFARRPPMDEASYQSYLSDAVTLEGRPGDLLYWPSSYWHVGESDTPEPVVVFNIALYLGGDPFAAVSRQVGRMVQRFLAPRPAPEPVFSVPGGDLQAAALHLPPALAACAEGFKGVLRGPLFDLAVRGGWLDWLSGSGFDVVPPPLPIRALAGDARVEASRAGGILSAGSGPGFSVISANGHARAANASPALARLIERLNRPGKERVSALIALGAGGESTPEEVRGLLEFLLSVRALRQVFEPAAPDERAILGEERDG